MSLKGRTVARILLITQNHNTMKTVTGILFALALAAPTHAQETEAKPVSIFQMIADSFWKAGAQFRASWHAVAFDFNTTGRAVGEITEDRVRRAADNLETAAVIAAEEGRYRVKRAAAELEDVSREVRYKGRVHLNKAASSLKSAGREVKAAAEKNGETLKRWFRRAKDETRENLQEAEYKVKKAETRLLDRLLPALDRRQRELDRDLDQMAR